MKRLLTMVLCVCVITSVSADMFTPSYSCLKPSRLYKFNSEGELESFKNKAKAYKQCINDFIEKQNYAIKKHQDAAAKAIDDWNNYIKYELN